MSHFMSVRRAVSVTAGAAALGLVLAACGGDPTAREGDGEQSPADVVTVGSAAFPESEIIAEIYAQALEAKGIEVRRQLNIGAREVYIRAIEDGEIDLVPEYSGNLLSHYDPDTTATSPEQVEDALDDVIPESLDVLDLAPAEDKDSLNVTREFSEENGVTSIADLADIDGLRLAANPEFSERAYGIPGMEAKYGITGVEFTAISDGGGPATLKALLDGDVDVADIYSTTPSITANDLVTLEDPENMIAAQNVVPLIRDDNSTDQIEDILDAVSAQLTTADLLDLNAQNVGDDKVAPADLAKQWLTDKGLI